MGSQEQRTSTRNQSEQAAGSIHSSSDIFMSQRKSKNSNVHRTHFYEYIYIYSYLSPKANEQQTQYKRKKGKD